MAWIGAYRAYIFDSSFNRFSFCTATELAYAEIISYNKKNLEKKPQNESRQHIRQQSKIHKRREKFNVNFIVKTGVFLYNGSVAGAIYIISPVTEFKRLR